MTLNAPVKPGVLVRDVSNAGFEAYVERGYLDSVEARAMPWNWEAMPDGTPRPFKHQYVPDEDWERQGRKLMQRIGINSGDALGEAFCPTSCKI